MASFDAKGDGPTVLGKSILAASIFQASYFFFHVRRHRSVLRTASKTGATVLLSVFAFHRDGITLLPLALLLGSLGDYFLAIEDTERNFLQGLGSFLFAHLMYIKLLLDNSSGHEMLFSSSSRLLVLSVFSAVAPGLNYAMLSRVPSGLRIPIIVYSAAIFVMLVSALCVTDTVTASGAILFTLSDSLLATDRFLLPNGSKHAAWMQFGVWVFYYSGQLLLALGLSS